MKTKTIGEILRSEREAKHLSLTQLAKKSKIKLHYLKALEDNRFQDLPAATFVKGYIRTYAEILDFDYQPLIALLRRDFKESAKGCLVPREFIKPIMKRRQFWQPATFLVMGLALIFLSLVGYVGAQWHRLNRPPALEIITPAPEELVASRVLVRGQTENDAIVTVNSQPVALQPDGAFQTEILLTREGSNTISIEAKDRQGRSTLEQRTVQVKF
jgi:cytoskeletal protein RodZ